MREHQVRRVEEVRRPIPRTRAAQEALDLPRRQSVSAVECHLIRLAVVESAAAQIVQAS